MLHPHLVHRLGAERRRDLTAESARAATSAPARRSRRRALLAVAIPAVLAAAVLPAGAEAADISAGNGFVNVLDRGFFSGGSTEANNVTVSVLGSALVITDAAGITVSQNDAGCVRFSGVEARCVAGRVTNITANLAAGSDRIEYRAPHAGRVLMGSDNDVVHAGIREAAGQTIQPITYEGEAGSDLISYQKATSGVTVDMADGVANDGRPGDRENLVGGFEHIDGSNFRDTLFGTPGPDGIAGGLDRDIIAGGGGDDIFYSAVKDGADDYHGGPGQDTIEYFGRTQPLKVQLDNTATDGEAGEFDNVRSNVENINGGAGADTLDSFSAFSRLDGRGGADTLNGGDGPDTLIGGPGRDALSAGSGSDFVDARDGEPDFVDCGTEADGLSRDTSEGIIKGCESTQVGVLRLATRAIDAEAGKTARVKLSWRHPAAWRNLRDVTLRLVRDGVAVGDVSISPRGERIDADGAVKLARRASSLSRRGKTVTARLALRIDASMAGQKLALEVEATDTRGRRQLERNAGTIRVAK